MNGCDFLERRLFGVPRWGWMILAYLFVIVMGVIGLARVEHVHNDQIQFVRERAVRDCELVNQTNTFVTLRLRTVVELIFGIDNAVSDSERRALAYIDETAPAPANCLLPPKGK